MGAGIRYPVRHGKPVAGARPFPLTLSGPCSCYLIADSDGSEYLASKPHLDAVSNLIGKLSMNSYCLLKDGEKKVNNHLRVLVRNNDSPTRDQVLDLLVTINP